MKKKIPILILLLITSFTSVAQTFSNDNFIYTSAPKKEVKLAQFSALTKDEANQNVTYFDGLGRPIQTIAIGQGGGGQDIITHIEYDRYGRQEKDFLPYPFANGGTDYSRIAIDAVVSGLNSIYNTDNYDNTLNPYSQKLFEPSPLSKVLKQAAPGNSWVMDSGHEIKFNYQTNTSTDAVKFYQATTNWNSGLGLYDIAFLDNGSYAENQLYKTITYDENSGSNPLEKAGSTVEFKNKEGQIVLKRTYESQIGHDTYYVYDIYGNLTYVIPPKADTTITEEVLTGLCYQYKYDYRNRLVEKKLPGKQWEFIVYDKLDRPVATGPANSPFTDGITAGWLITKYDIFSRPIYTGWLNEVANSDRRKALQTVQNAAIVLFEEKNAAGSINDVPAYYTNTNTPTTFNLLTVNYYDNYNYPDPPPSLTGADILENAKGLPTGNWTRVLTTASVVLGETTATFYDSKARPIQNYTKNHLGGSTIIDSELDFLGKTMSATTKHTRASGAPVLKIKENFTYSTQDRLLTHTHQINDEDVQLLAENSYNELGQLKIKNVAGNSNNNLFQKIDYKYNIRGWLTAINKIGDGNLKQGSDPVDLFAFKINYNSPQLDISDVNPLFNGNISETLWKTNADQADRGYAYKYDKLNRLNEAVYVKNSQRTDAYNESLGYDKNGNIKFLGRTGDTDEQVQPNKLDDLIYTYPDNSNKLTKIADNTNNPSGFNDVNETGNDYDYDDNGNLIIDNNKNIANISYNHLNLPKKITFGTENTIEYIYNAAGKKLEKIVTEIGSQPVNTKYLGGFQYKNDVLEFFPTAEGYVKNDNGLSYVFQYKDHLGNSRLSYAKKADGTGLEIIEENNYYPFGLKHNGYNDDHVNNYKYKFLGQERQDELGLNWDTFRHRNYDYAIGRFFGVDPVSEEYMSISTYQFAHNNPVWKIEIEGLEGAPSNGKPDIGNHEPVKVINQEARGVPGYIVESKVVQEGTEKVVEKVAGALSPVTKTITNVVSLGVTLLSDYMSPNFGKTNEMKAELKHQITGDGVKTSLKTTPYSSETEKSDGEVVYRGGSFTDANFTPRPGKDDGVGLKSGLSTFTDPIKATMGEGGKAQALSVDLLKGMGFQLTNVGGHVGVRPPNQTLLEKWAESRGTAPGTNPAQILTEMVKSARIQEIKVPKTN